MLYTGLMSSLSGAVPTGEDYPASCFGQLEESICIFVVVITFWTLSISKEFVH